MTKTPTEDRYDGMNVRILLPDGGQVAAKEDGKGAENQAQQAEEDDVPESEAEDEAEATERAESGQEDATTVLHLNLDGLFLDLLGLEVDLDRVTLDIDAVSGEGNLLGNLLSAVSGLLDSPGLGSLLGVGGDGDTFPDLPSLPNPVDLDGLNVSERIRKIANGMTDRIRGFFDDVIQGLPLEELLAMFLEELVRQILDSEVEDDDTEATASG